MAVILINPNSTVAMTETMVAQARAAAPDLSFEGWTSHDGPPAIQGAVDGAAATPPLLELVAQACRVEADGIIIACFDDTALEEAAARATCPVIGIGQAAYHFAALHQWRFSVVTTLSVSIPVLEANIARLGLDRFAAKVRASDVPVLALEADPQATAKTIVQEALMAEAHDGISAVILGCGGMVQVVEQVQSALTIPTIDPVACAARSMTWLADTP